MKTVISNADFSALGIGSADFVNDFCLKASITGAKKTAVKTFYDDCKGLLGDDLWAKLYWCVFFPGTTPQTQKFVFNENIDEVLFTTEASAHTAAGFVPANGVCISPFVPPAGVVDNFSFGVYNATATTPNSGDAIQSLMGSFGENTNSGAVGKYDMLLSRNWGGDNKTLSNFEEPSGGNFVFPATYDNLKTGLLQLVKTGSVYKLVDGGDVIQTANAGGGFNPTGGGNRTIVIGGKRQPSGALSNFCPTTYQFAYAGSLSLAEAQSFDTIVTVFLGAFHA